MIAAIRPGDVSVALFFHVAGAMMLVGTLLFVATTLLLGWRRTDPVDGVALTRHGLRTFLIGVLPAYVVMRIGAQWTESAADYPDSYSPTWLDVGYLVADAGALLVLIGVVVSAVGLRRLRTGGGVGLARAAGVLAAMLLVAYLVAVWAMSAKPG